MKQEKLNERYKKLKQSDRMEYLAINSIYEKRDNTYTIIYFLSISIKIFIMMIIAVTLFSAINIAADIKGVEGMNLSDIGEGYFDQTLGEFLGAILIMFLFLFTDFGMLLIMVFNNKQRNKRLDEFLKERKV